MKLKVILVCMFIMSSYSIKANEVIYKDQLTSICSNEITNPIMSDEVYQNIQGNDIYLYGNNAYGVMGVDPKIQKIISSDNAIKLSLPNNETIKKYYVTKFNVYALSTSNKLYARGYNTLGQVKNSNEKVYHQFQLVTLLKNKTISSILFSYDKEVIEFAKMRLDIYFNSTNCSEDNNVEKSFIGFSRNNNALIERETDLYYYKYLKLGNNYSIQTIEYDKNQNKSKETTKVYNPSINSKHPTVTTTINYNSKQQKTQVKEELLYKSFLYTSKEEYYYYINSILKSKYINYFYNNDNNKKSIYQAYQLDAKTKKNRIQVNNLTLYRYNGSRIKYISKKYQYENYKSKKVNSSEVRYYNKFDNITKAKLMYYNSISKRKVAYYESKYQRKKQKNYLVTSLEKLYYNTKKNSVSYKETYNSLTKLKTIKKYNKSNKVTSNKRFYTKKKITRIKVSLNKNYLI